MIALLASFFGTDCVCMCHYLPCCMFLEESVEPSRKKQLAVVGLCLG